MLLLGLAIFSSLLLRHFSDFFRLGSQSKFITTSLNKIVKIRTVVMILADNLWHVFYPQSVKGYQHLISKLSPPLLEPLPPLPSFLKTCHPLTSPENRSSQVSLINRNATVKLSSINTIHAKQQHNLGFFIFKVTLKYILCNVYINKIHARQCLYIKRLYCREGFSHSFNFFVVSKGILNVSFQNSEEENFFQWSNFQLIPICYYANKRILYQLISKSLVFNLIAILTKNLSFYCTIYIQIIY